MPTSPIELDYWDVALASLLILVNAGLSLSLRLGMERTLLIASVRTVVQLLLIGLILEWVFGLEHWYAVAGVMLVMTLIAGLTAVRRAERPYPGIWLDTMLTILVSSWSITAFALLVVVRGEESWYQPQYSIPLLGMVLGNTLNGISLGMNTLTDALAAQRRQIETLLSLGASRWEAASGPVRQAVRTGMIPIINSMMIVGIVSLPGMMTGQLLSGTAPIQAVRYQIVIMFLVASATALGTVGVVICAYLRMFNSRHQFLYRLVDRRELNSRSPR